MIEKNGVRSPLVLNILRVLIANSWVAIIGFLGSFVFPKILTVEDYAYYHTFTLYIGYIAILHLGFPSGMVINYAGKNYKDLDKKQYKSELLILLCILSFFTAIFILAWLIVGSRIILYVGCGIIPVCVNGSFYALMQAWSQFKKYTRLSMFVSAAIPVCAIGFYFLKGELPGDVYICIYLIVYWLVCFYILAGEVRSVKGVKCNSFLTSQNIATEKTGISLTIGNYMNTLLGSADKQFVSWFYGTQEFAFYSFSMAMQTLMTVFITSISQPLFPAMAQGRFCEKDYPRVKRILFVFGSFSCCAYFAISIVVKGFIQKYVGSLEIVRLYFIVFPAMAVVNCLYINLYKIKNKMKLYIKTLLGIMVCAIALNSMAVYLFDKYSVIALATAITYYVWLFVGGRQFNFIDLNWIDILYLGMFIIGFFLITNIPNDYLGLFCSVIFVLALSFGFYHTEIIEILYKRKEKSRNE